MSAVLDWVKANVASVIFFVVMIAALVALPIVSKRMNSGVQALVKDRVKQLGDLNKLEKTTISFGNPVLGPPESRTVLVNERLLARYREVIDADREDAQLVVQMAIDHNKQDHTVLLRSLFPEPAAADREVLPEQFHNIVSEAYVDLLASIDAGMPPSTESVVADITRRRAQFLTQTLQKDVDDALDDDEAAQLQEILSGERMSKYAQQADELGIYAEVEALRPPEWLPTHPYTLGELYEWQWQYWAVEDIVLALDDANSKSDSVQQAPVKRIVELTMLAQSDAPAAGGGDSGGFGTGGRSSAASEAPEVKPANPAQEIKPDFAYSITGRTTNPLYDIRELDLVLVIETAKLTDVIDALARRNFIAVLDLDLTPEDHYAAAGEGYFYGREPVSLLRLRLETVWLRSWTREFMPAEVKAALGVADPPAASG